MSGVPIPDEPYVSLPGFAFAYATKSFNVRAGTEGCTVRTYCAPAMRLMGLKSLSGSYGVRVSAGFIAMPATNDMSSV